jgi:hypothetical protein
MTIEERKAIYQNLCEQGKITSLFNQPWWLEATGPWDVSLGMRNEQVVGAMPFATGRRMGMSTIGMPALTHHLRIWMDKPPDVSDQKWLAREKQIIGSILDELPAFGYFSMVFDEKSFDNWLPFHWKKFRQEMRYTFVIDRADPETIDQQLNRNLKRNLREAEEEIMINREVDANTFYELCRDTFAKQKKKMPYSQEFFNRLDQAIQKNNAGIKLGAINNRGNFIAVSYLVWDQDNAYYLLAGDNEEGRVNAASIVVCREALQIAFEERKVSTFDFCGSMLENITDMRRQFGAHAVPLMKIFKARWKWLDLMYSLKR